MAERRKVTRKVISKITTDQVETPLQTAVEEGDVVPAVKSKRKCIFCQNKKEPQYSDVVSLRKFITDRGRILPRLRSGVCSKHQRRVTKQIKYARHLALLPFTPKV